jgi:hypothetical protein
MRPSLGRVGSRSWGGGLGRYAGLGAPALRLAARVASLGRQVAAVAEPLCRRPAAHEEGLADVLGWRKAVLERIAALGDAFAAADDGPAADELKVSHATDGPPRTHAPCCALSTGTLRDHPHPIAVHLSRRPLSHHPLAPTPTPAALHAQREVEWALDDAVAAVRPGPSAAWEACSWHSLQLDVQAAQRRGQWAGSAPGDEGEGWAVWMRAPVRDLQGMWERRLQVRWCWWRARPLALAAPPPHPTPPHPTPPNPHPPTHTTHTPLPSLARIEVVRV